MIPLAIAIQAHPKRADRVTALFAQLDPFAPVTVVMDHESAGPWPTAKRCWESMDPRARHALILQDDVLLCRDFFPAAVEALRWRGDGAVSFYANHQAVDDARAEGRSWAAIPADRGIWGQAQCLPTFLVRPFLAWEAQQPVWADVKKTRLSSEPRKIDDDWILGQFLKAFRVPVWATVPSLVQHDCPTESLIGFGNRTKVARWFIGTERSGLEIDWRKGL